MFFFIFSVLWFCENAADENSVCSSKEKENQKNK